MNTSVTELLQSLIRIPSVNPEGNQPPEISGELRCAEFVSDYLTKLGAHAELVEVFPNRPNVVAHFPSDRAGKPKLLLAPHLDTVTIDGMTVAPFEATIANGKIFGRGASDTKGTIAAMLWALREIGQDRIAKLNYEIWFAGLMGEETGQHGSKYLAERFKPDFVLIGEPTNLQVVFTHKGCVRLRLVTKGVAVHSSNPQAGENAIDKMLDALTYLRAELERVLLSDTDSTLGQATFSIGIIRGGARINIVPDHCEAEIDIRTLPVHHENEFPSTLIRGLKQKFPDMEIETTISGPLYTDPQHPLVQRLSALGNGTAGAAWFCDAASFSAVGVPAVAAGPGRIEQAHTKDEFIAIDDLKKGVDFYREFLLQS